MKMQTRILMILSIVVLAAGYVGLRQGNQELQRVAAAGGSP